MRNVWDGKKEVVKRQGVRLPMIGTVGQGSAVFSKSRKAFGRRTEEGLAKTKKYFLEHLELKRVVMDFFPDYQKYLGEGGFTSTP